MKNISTISFKQRITIYAKLIQLHKVIAERKKVAFFYCFNIFTPLFITFNTEFIPQTYNYGKNYPRSGIL